MTKKSPFPGMDPYLEEYWSDVHHRMITYLGDLIQARLPAGLYAAFEETVYFLDINAEDKRIRPDVAVIRRPKTSSRPQPSAGIATATEPIRISFYNDPITVGHIEIREIDKTTKVVTVIELISPANKIHSRNRQEYLDKRQVFYESNVNVVEIDLLRSGKHIIGVPLEAIPDGEVTPYMACVRRSPVIAGIELEYYPISLRKRLPRISTPLRKTDDDVILDLQEGIDTIFDRGGLGYRLDYSKPPDPPLSPDDAAWANELIAAAKS